MKIGPKAFSAKIGSKLCPSKKMPNTFKILPNWQNFAKSGHTADHFVIDHTIFKCLWDLFLPIPFK